MSTSSLKADIGVIKNITILLVDIVDSSRILIEQSSESFNDVIDRVTLIIREAVQKNNGDINTFLGDGLMAVFGLSSKSMGHANEAIMASNTILKNLRLANDKEIQVRIGIATGPAIVSTPENLKSSCKYKIIGKCVHLAARLEKIAQPMTACISQRTYLLTRYRYHNDTFLDVGKVFISKSSKKTYQAYRFSTLKNRSEELNEKFVGRKYELQKISTIINGQNENKPFFLILGEAGIGKTTFLKKILDGLDDYKKINLNFTPEKSGFFKESLISISSQINSNYKNFGFYEVNQFVKKIIENDNRKIIIIEDMHWANEDDLKLVSVLIEEANRNGVYVFGTTRDFDQNKKLNSTNIVETILHPFTKEEVVRYFGQVLKKSSAEDIFNHTAGYPLVTSMIQKALKDNILQEKDVDPSSFASSYIDYILSLRVKNYPKKITKTLKVAASLGQVFEKKILIKILNEKNLDKHLDKLVKDKILIKKANDNYEFYHQKIHESIYDNILDKKKIFIHGKAYASYKNNKYNFSKIKYLKKLAKHSEKAGIFDSACLYNYFCAKYFYESGLYETALEHVKKITALLNKCEKKYKSKFIRNVFIKRVLPLSIKIKLSQGSYSSFDHFLELPTQNRKKSKHTPFGALAKWMAGDFSGATRYSIENIRAAIKEKNNLTYTDSMIRLSAILLDIEKPKLAKKIICNLDDNNFYHPQISSSLADVRVAYLCVYGRCFASSKDQLKAKKYFDKAIFLSKEINQPMTTLYASLYCGIGMMDIENFDQAIKYLEIGLKETSKIEKSNLLLPFYKASKSYCDYKNRMISYKEVNHIINSSVSESKKSNMRCQLAKMLFWLSEIHKENGKIEQYKEVANLGVKIAKEQKYYKMVNTFIELDNRSAFIDKHAA